MNENEIKAIKIMRRIEKVSQEFSQSTKIRGISNEIWTNYYQTMMRLGTKLKQTGIKYKPRSRNYPIEFRQLFIRTNNETINKGCDGVSS